MAARGAERQARLSGRPRADTEAQPMIWCRVMAEPSRGFWARTPVVSSQRVCWCGSLRWGGMPVVESTDRDYCNPVVDVPKPLYMLRRASCPRPPGTVICSLKTGAIRPTPSASRGISRARRIPRCDVAIQLGARAGGSHGPVVNSSVSASSLSLPHLVAVDRSVSYTHLRAHETDSYLVCRLLL